jgi:two-component system NarL family response regulator
MRKVKSIRILIAHSQPLLRDGFRYRVDQQPDMKVVAEAGTQCQAVSEFLLQRPDVALTELGLRMNGRNAVEAIRERAPLASVIIMMSRDSNVEIERLLKAGAKAILLNDSPWWDVVKCSRAVHEGQLILPAEVEHMPRPQRFNS